MPILGVDIGGTGIKGALVDPVTGLLVSERRKIATPHPATPEAVSGVVAQLVGEVESEGAIGFTFPAVVQHGVIRTAANVDESWIATDAREMFSGVTGRACVVMNDADAAGVAEMEHGAGKGATGTVLMLTLGTGIGSALFSAGQLVPNTELGHLEIDGKEAEHRASNTVREHKDLSWKKFAHHLDVVLLEFERLLTPDLFIIGGGISKKADHYLPELTITTPIEPAQLRNQAGIVGAAMAASKLG
jgi:polyphosphate glucokinase